MSSLNKWTVIALTNLGIVAVLGFVMRCKMIFSIPFLDFKYILHAHSHFAFGGWVTLSLLAIMSYRLLPIQASKNPVYRWLLGAILVNAAGMLFSFPFQGYGAFSILFSTVFVFVTYGYAYVFSKDMLRSAATMPVKLLSVGAVVYMALSSAGAFTLAYLLATKSQNVILYKDAIYTYLHLQYSGFFTLAVFAIWFHHLGTSNRHTLLFAHLLNASVIPSMFISYLWHFPGVIVRAVAISGTTLIVLATAALCLVLPMIGRQLRGAQPLVRTMWGLALASFLLKQVFQAVTIVPSLGPLVFANRPVIIGFLHLVLLSFVTLYLLGYFLQNGLIGPTRQSASALKIFITGVMLNNLFLFGQGLGFMLMVSSALMNWLLLLAAACLLTGAGWLATDNWRSWKLPAPSGLRGQKSIIHS